MLLNTIAGCASYAFGSVLIICEMGQRMSYAFDEIGDMIWHLDWYSYSNKLQRMLPTVMMAAKQPVAVKFFGSLSCSRDSLQKALLFINMENRSTILLIQFLMRIVFR